jgi:mono/diheme cytochrome c family protein
MKKLFIMALIACSLYACSGGAGSGDSDKSNAGNTGTEANPAYDPHRGEGKFDHVEVGATLSTTMADAGKKVYDVKCGACHKLTNEKLVGPGWEGVTKKLSPEWIMNFITNPDVMIDKDPHAQAQLEICLVRMPNQNLSDDDARNVLEFMRKNDGVK